MGHELRTARHLLVAGGLLAVFQLPAPLLPVGLAEAVQAFGHVLLLVAGLRVRSVVTNARVPAPTGAAVLLLVTGLGLYAVGAFGMGDGRIVAALLAPPAWATGALLTMWSAARTLDATDSPGASTWQLAFLAGVLVWVPLSFVFVRVAAALLSGATDEVDLGAHGAAGVLVFLGIMLPFAALLGGNEPTVSHATEEARV